MKKQTIRIFALVLVVVMLWSLVACDATQKAPATTTPEVTEPEVTEPEATEPEVTEPEVTEPEATEPEATEPEATEPEATEPEATEPEATEPEATEPEVTEPEVTEPEVTEPEATEPEAVELDFSVNNNLKTGSVEVHSVTYRDLDNGYIRITVDCTVSEGLSFFAFNPPSGELFRFRGGPTVEGRQTITYDLLKEVAMAVKNITMSFYGSGDDSAAYLNYNLIRTKMKTTDGKPVGEAVGLDFSVDNNLKTGSVEVHSVTYRDLDNGYIRITVDCTVSEGLSFTAFNPPSGELFAFTGGPTVEGRQTITYDLLKEDAMAVKNITMSFSGSGNGGSAFLFYDLIRTKMKTTDGKPVGEAMELDFSVDNRLKTGSVEVHSVTCWRLDNGYVRIAVDCTTSEEMPTSAYDIPFEDHFLLIGDRTVEGRQTITYDLLAEDVQSIEAVEMRFKYDNSDTVFVRFDPNASFDVTP